MRAQPEDLKTVDWKKAQIDLRHLAPLTVMGYTMTRGNLVEIHHKSDGTIDEKPSFLFLHVIPEQGYMISEVSLNTLNHNLQKIGMKLVSMNEKEHRQAVKQCDCVKDEMNADEKAFFCNSCQLVHKQSCVDACYEDGGPCHAELLGGKLQ